MPFQDLKHISLSAGTIAYYDIGQGKPIVLLHGFPDTPHTFCHQIQALNAQGYRCILPYLPGYGESSIPTSGGCSVFAVATLLDAFITRLVPQTSVVIYGHDWGSIIAQCIASFHDKPTKAAAYTLDRLILCAVPPLRFFITNLNIRQLYRSRYMGYFQLPNITTKIKHQKQTYIRKLWSRWSPNVASNDPQIDNVIQTLNAKNSLHHAVLYYRYLLNPLYIPFGHKPLKVLWHLLRSKKIPCLIIVGKNDGCIGQELFKNAIKGYPHPRTKLVVIENAGHFTHYEQPDLFNQAILDFLS